VGVNGAKSEINVDDRRDHEWSAEDFSESVKEIAVVGIVVIVIVGHHSTRTDIGMYVGLLVGIIKTRRRTTSRET